MPVAETLPELKPSVDSDSLAASEAEDREAIPAVNDLTSDAGEQSSQKLRMVPILPKLTGFTMFESDLSNAFAAEQRRDSWAASQELELFRTTQKSLERLEIDAGALEIECRATMCGIVVVPNLDETYVLATSDRFRGSEIQSLQRELRRALEDEYEFHYVVAGEVLGSSAAYLAFILGELEADR